jgi:hypothetical protein
MGLSYPKVVTPIDVPFDHVSVVLREIRVKAVPLGDSAALVITGLFVLFVMAMSRIELRADGQLSQRPWAASDRLTRFPNFPIWCLFRVRWLQICQLLSDVLLVVQELIDLPQVQLFQILLQLLLHLMERVPQLVTQAPTAAAVRAALILRARHGESSADVQRWSDNVYPANAEGS